jgi:hypothetical protein
MAIWVDVLTERDKPVFAAVGQCRAEDAQEDLSWSRE